MQSSGLSILIIEKISNIYQFELVLIRPVRLVAS